MCGSWPLRGQCSKIGSPGNSLAVQWLGLHAFTAEGPDWILVGEQKSHKPCDAGGKKKKNTGSPVRAGTMLQYYCRTPSL